MMNTIVVVVVVVVAVIDVVFICFVYYKKNENPVDILSYNLILV